MSLQDLFDALTRRLRAFQHGDAGEILDPRALDEATTLLDQCAGTEHELAAIHVAAVLHYYRCRALPAAEKDHEFDRSVRLFALVDQVRPDLVPPDVRDRLGPPAGTADPDPARPLHLASQIMAAGDWARLDEAIAGLETVLAAVVPDRVVHDLAAAMLASALKERSARDSNEADLDLAIQVAREALSRHIDQPALSAQILTTLAAALETRFHRSGEVVDLDDAISAGREATRKDVENPAPWNTLGISLLTRYRRTADIADLDEAVASSRAAARCTPADHRYRGQVLAGLFNAISVRSAATEDHADLTELVDLARDLLSLAPEGSQDRATKQTVLAELLLRRARLHRDDTTSADEAIDLLRTVATTSAEPAVRAFAKRLLARPLFRRLGSAPQIGALDEAIRLAEEAVAATPPDASYLLSDLATAWETRFGVSNRPTDLDNAIRTAREAMSVAPDDALLLMHLRHTLARCLRTRYELSGRAADLEDAVSYARSAVASTPAGEPPDPAGQDNLAVLLQKRFERHRRPDDLRDAVQAAREAVTATPEDAPELPGRMATLAVALRKRFEEFGGTADLHESVRIVRAAFAKASPESPAWPVLRSNLASALQARYDRFETAADLDEAIRLRREASGAHDKLALARALIERFSRSAAMADVDECIGVARQAIAGTGDRTREDFHSALGIGLLTRYRTTGQAEDLDEAVGALRASADAMTTDDPDRPAALSNLAAALEARFEAAGAEADIDEAERLRTAAQDNAAAPAFRRIAIAYELARTRALRHGIAAALPQFATTIDLLPLLTWRGSEHPDVEHLLRTHVRHLACDAAAAAIAAGEPEKAVELLEQGRGLYWAQLLDLRADLGGLAGVAPQLAAELVECRNILDAPGPYERGVSAESPTAMAARLHAAQRFDDLLVEIRNLPASEMFPEPQRFLMPVPAAGLLPGRGHGPTVIVNVSRWRCDALIVTDEGVTALPLMDQTGQGDLTLEEVYAVANRYLRALQNSRSSLGLNATVQDTLEWLWRTVARPVLDRLGHTATPPDGSAWPRVWWCPTGPLTLLPLHAAGEAGAGTDNVHERVVSSYTTTLRALRHIRVQPDTTAPQSMLVIALPDTPGQRRLPNVEIERDFLVRMLPSYTLLEGDQAGRDSILSALGRHRWLHGACHGIQRPGLPGIGGLVPWDWQSAGMVSVIDLTRLRHGGGEFAFLSACMTAVGGTLNPDEVITVASALQHTGWRHVIATLWTIQDDYAPLIAERVYREMLRSDGTLDAGLAAAALHTTIRRLRQEKPNDPGIWAPFVHTGL
ncbi:CHAT domain-containing protein [Dactylosporangium sp. NPDC005555]|uniref:CHAT domain-containing protein n=1 Tax=Dactylosporangium sp. NPDC005555 TaxID=3154889 RepID=UPI0033AFBD02